MTINELKEKRSNLKAELQTMVSTAETEQRKLNETEDARMAEIRNEIEVLDGEIRTAEEENKRLLSTAAIKEKTIRTMPNLLKTIAAVANHRALDEATTNEIEAARSEFRKSGLSSNGDIVLRTAIQATSPTNGQENVPEVKTPIELALRNALVANKMGANYLGGLVGDVSIPKYTGSNVAWAEEIGEATDGAGTFSEVTLKPHRLTAILDISKQFLLQDSHDAETMLINDIVAAVAEKLDKTIFGAEAGDTTKPAGLFHGVGAEASLDAVDYNAVLGIEQKMEEKNAGDYLFIASPSVKFALKGVQKANGLGFICEGQEIDGIRYISSNSVNAKSIVAIDPKSLVIGQWGGIDITVDSVTQASKGCIRLVINSYWDAQMKSDRIEKVVFS